MSRVSIFLGILMLSACASSGVYDVEKVQQNLTLALQRSDEVATKAQSDYAEKKNLVENLGKGGASEFREAEPALRTRLGEMEASLERLTAQHKKMMTASSDLASLAYGQKSVSSSDANSADKYDKIDEEVKAFQAAADQANVAMADYSRSSNALTDTIVAKKLYMTFASDDFFKRTQRDVKVAQENARQMQREIDHASQTGRGDPATMESLAQSYTEKAQRLASISKEMRLVTADQRATSLDAQWPEVQKLLTESDSVTRELETINQKFQKSAQEFRANQKRPDR